MSFNRLTTLSGVDSSSVDLGAAVGARVSDGATLKSAIDQLTPQQGQDWGPSFPAVVWPGRKFFRTDINQQFYWDDARSAWLGELQWVTLSEPQDDNQIQFSGMAVSNMITDGAEFPYNIIITRIFFRTRGNETITFSLFRNGSIFENYDLTSEKFFDTGDISIAFAARDLLGARVTNTATGNFQRLYGQIQYRKVMT